MDCESVFVELKKSFQRRLDYRKFVNWLQDSYELTIMTAYGNLDPFRTKTFSFFLRDLGFQVNFKPDKSWKVDITLLAASLIGKIDALVLVVNDPDYKPLVPWAIAHGVRVHIIHHNIPRALSEISFCSSFPLEFLENETDKTAEQVDVSPDVTGDGDRERA